MSRNLLIRTILALSIATSVLATETPPPAVVEIKGEIVDLRCHLSRGAAGPSHAACAARCIKSGVPAGLLTEDGRIILLIDLSKISKDLDLADRIGKPVIVTGSEMERAGMRAIQVSEVNEP